MNSFRPLSGSYISQLLKKKMHKNTPIVSVPYRGATFLNMSTVILKITCVHVSVPYRGATFLNHQNSSFSISLTVSVPYRGATFLNAQRASIQRCLHSVSVPYRGATFLNHQLTTRQYCIIGFRPLSGSYISQ